VIVLARTRQLYEDNGVEISKATINVGDEVTVLYRGLLAQSGADSVYAHIGYGDNWEAKEFIPMEKDKDVFKATIKVNLSDNLNIAFKDSVDNWDNNSQQNYSFNVSAKASRKSSTSTEKKASPKVKASATKSETAKEASATKTKTAKTKAATSTKTAAKKTTSSKTTTAKKSTAAKKTSK
jgi:FKBP-type peptidyl-prolyl cis-trans isomerase